jgi:hypothetical protein
MNIWLAIWPGVTVVDATEPTATVTLVFDVTVSGTVKSKSYTRVFVVLQGPTAGR